LLPEEADALDVRASHRRAYFRRVWIIQEVALALVAWLHCGTSTLHPAWDELEKAFNFAIQIGALSVYTQALSQNFSAIQTSRHTVASADVQNLKLSVLLSHHRSSLATNPRDKAFALFGLSGQIASEDIEIAVNYDTSLDDLYKALAIKVIQHDGSLDILSATILSRPAGKDAKLNVPSWVPHWSLENPPSSIRYDGLEALEECRFHASSKHPSYEYKLENDNVLVVQEQIIDEIAEVGAVYSGYERAKMQSIFSYFPLFCDELRVLSDWETVAGARSGQCCFNGEDMLQVYRQTINSGLQRNGYVLRFKYIHWLRLDRFEWTFKATMFLSYSQCSTSPS
jgi:hypothetical protein